MKNIFVTALLILIATTLFSQVKKPQNLRRYDQKKLHFGFSLGLNTTDFYMRNSDTFFNEVGIGNVYSIENSQNLGFHLGPISDFRLGEYFNLRFLINLSFSQRDLTYTVFEDTLNGKPVFETHTMILPSTFIEFPLLLKYKSKRINNFRPYLITGVSPKFDFSSKKKIKPEEMPKIRLNQFDVYYEIGAGIDMYTTYFKFSTELKYAVGFLNMANPDNTVYTSSFNYLKSNMVVLSFHFE